MKKKIKIFLKESVFYVILISVIAVLIVFTFSKRNRVIGWDPEEGKPNYPQSSKGDIETSDTAKVYLEPSSEPFEEEIDYGISAKGRTMQAFRYGSGKNVLVCSFAIHGFEDAFYRDGEALVNVAEKLRNKLLHSRQILEDHDWCVWVLPCLNPDGLAEGWSSNGPGRCTIGSDNSFAMDINRCFPAAWKKFDSSRYYNGNEPLACAEAKAISKLMESIMGSGENIHIDVHGWTTQTITSDGREGRLFSTFADAFPNNTWADIHNGEGYLANYTSELGYDSCLFEFPAGADSVEAFLTGTDSDRFIECIFNLLQSNPVPNQRNDWIEPQNISVNSDLLLCAPGYAVIEKQDDLVSLMDVKNRTYFVRDRNVFVSKTIVEPLNAMMEAYFQISGEKTINVVAGWRSFAEQRSLYERAVDLHGEDYAKRFFANPGESEHHTGCAIDLSVFYAESGLSDDFEAVGRYEWFAENAASYGFILRYPPDKENITHICSEPWHYRYVGRPHAIYMNENNLCLEEYLNLLEENHSFEKDHLIIEEEQGRYEVYSCLKDSILVPKERPFSISETNKDFVVVTVVL